MPAASADAADNNIQPRHRVARARSAAVGVVVGDTLLRQLLLHLRHQRYYHQLPHTYSHWHSHLRSPLHRTLLALDPGADPVLGIDLGTVQTVPGLG